MLEKYMWRSVLLVKLQVYNQQLQQMNSFTGIFKGFYLDFKDAGLSLSYQILKSPPYSQQLWEILQRKSNNDC